MLVEERGIPVMIGISDKSIGFCDGVYPPGRNRLHQACPDGEPFLTRSGGSGRGRYRKHVGHLCHRFVTCCELSKGSKACLVEFFAIFAVERCFESGWDGLLEGINLAREILRPLGPHAVFQTLVQHQRIAEVIDGRLIGGALCGLHTLYLPPLVVDFLQKGGEFAVTEIFSLVLLPTEEPEHLGVVDHECGVVIGHGGVEEHICQPVTGIDFPTIVQKERLLAADDEKRGSCHRVKRLVAAL